MNITIHRGTHEIGGSCIEITSSTTRIFLDFGLPLMDKDGHNVKLGRKGFKKTYQELIEEGTAPAVPYFRKRDEKPTALLLTHSHLDHHGLAYWLPNDIPVYSSMGTKKLLETAFYFDQSPFNPAKVTILESQKPVTFGNLTITPFLADHSAIDAFSYLIAGEGKKIFYSGDIRSHGRTGYKFKNLLANPPPDIDYLILEGSTLGREVQEVKTEVAIEEQLVQEFSNEGMYLVSFSSQNIDRFVSFFKACRRTKRILVVDPYTASILDSLRDISANLPQFDWGDSFKVYFVNNSYTSRMGKDESLYRYKHAKITIEEIRLMSNRIVIKENSAIREKLRKEKMLGECKLIYSLWGGYLKDDNFWKENDVPIINIHSSGHAYKDDLIRLVKAMKPRRIIPNHTFNPENFASLFGAKALLLSDGETLEC